MNTSFDKRFCSTWIANNNLLKTRSSKIMHEKIHSSFVPAWDTETYTNLVPCHEMNLTKRLPLGRRPAVPRESQSQTGCAIWSDC